MTPDRDRLTNISHLSCRKAEFREPVSDIDLLRRVGPVFHGARDADDNTVFG
jgi:hypothetical protein